MADPVQAELMEARLKLRAAERELRAEKAKNESMASKGGAVELDLSELEIGDKVAGGGFGVIYQGEWRGTPVAVKKFFDQNADADMMKEYKDEVGWLSSLRHPNIALYIASQDLPPNLTIITEWAPHGTLFSLLHEKKDILLSDSQKALIALNIVRALNYLHKQRPIVCHCDINSRNVLIFEQPTGVKLCDFGLTKKIADCKPQKLLKGTPNYMSPELFKNEAPYNEKVDIFAFGILLNEIFSRECPYGGCEAGEIKDLCLNKQRPPIPVTAPEEVQELIAKCWEQDEGLRPSAEKCIDVLSKLI